MRRYLLLLTGMGLLLTALAGCGKQGWTARITDTQGNPLAGAKVCVWSTPVDAASPEQSAKAIGQAWEKGETTMHGWFFASDAKGLVRCEGIPTGKEVVVSSTRGKTVTSVDFENRHVYGDAKHGEHDEVGITQHDTYIPPTVRTRWKPGDWLAITITAPGYQAYHFAFRPDSASGDLGTYQLQAAK